ncbi:MAG: efflux RND transporter periplasmic adaptor subunit [Schleiferiaceae bacterium]
MKNLALASIALLLFACTEKDDLAKLQETKDSLKKEYKKIQEEIAVVDLAIAELDTTQKLSYVSTLEVESRNFSHYFEVYGNVEADFNATIYPEATGLVNRILVKEGQDVSKGQVLIELDNTLLLTQIDEAQTSYDLAYTLYEKQKSLWDQKIGSEVDYLRAKNSMEASKSRLKTLKEQVAKTKITAPFSGKVDAIYPKVGEMAMPQMSALRMVNMDKVYIKAEVAERYVNSVKPGTIADVSIDVIDFMEEVPIQRVSEYINPDNRTFTVQLDLNNKKNSLKPNMLASVKIKDYESDSTVVLPNRIILQNPQGNDYVFVIEPLEGGEKGKVVRQLITIGSSYRGETEILEGLKPGQILVDKGARSVKAGQMVAISK